MNSILLVLCCHLAVAFTARSTHEVRGLSIRTSASPTRLSDAHASLKRRQEKSTSTENPNAIGRMASGPREQASVADTKSDPAADKKSNQKAKSALRSYLASLKNATAALAAIWRNEAATANQVRIGVGAFFASLEGSLIIPENSLKDISNLIGVSEAKLQVALNKVAQDTQTLQKTLSKSTDKIEDIKAFLVNLLRSMPNSSEPASKPRQEVKLVKEFLDKLIKSISQSQNTSRDQKKNPNQTKAQLGTFLKNLSRGLSDLEAAYAA